MLKNFQEIMRSGAEHALLHLWSEELSNAEAMAIQSRVRKDPKYREEFFGLLEILGTMEELAVDSETQEIVPQYQRLIQGRSAKRKILLGIAATVLVTIGAVLTYFSSWRGGDDSHLQKYSTQIGKQQTIELGDGSVVTLNTSGQVVVDYNEQVRRILLERGEAYFEVAEDPERPFTVDLGLRSVTAIGTAFNIRKDTERYQLAVIEGAVTIHKATEDVTVSPPPVSIRGIGPRRVEAGLVAEFDISRDLLTAFRPESMDRYGAWRNGLLSFASEPLYQVVQELNRYSRKKILIEDASIMDLQVYTVIRIPASDSAVQSLQLILPIKVTQHYDRIVITASPGGYYRIPGGLMKGTQPVRDRP